MINDTASLLIVYYQANGATSDDLQDAEREFLIGQGLAPEANQDMWYDLLEVLGYTGALPDMMKDFWCSGGVATRNWDYLTRILTDDVLVQKLSGVLSWTRATTATYVDSDGIVQTAGVDEPRKEAEGWLLEGASTNDVLHSADFSAVAWDKVVAPTSITELAPDGSNTAYKVVAIPEALGIFVRQIFNYDYQGVYTLHCYVKGVAGDTVKLDFRNTGATYVIQTNHTYTGGWDRVSATLDTTGSTNTEWTLSLRRDVVNTGEECTYWGFQFEPLPFATSYIPTGASPVTRSADIVSIPFAGNHPDLTGRASEISYAFNVSLFGALGATQVVFGLGNIFQYSILRLDAGDTSLNYYRNNTPKALTVGDITDNNKYAITISGDTVARYSNGSLLYPPADEVPQGNTGNPTTILISPSTYGHISDFRIYDFVLTATEIELLSGS